MIDANQSDVSTIRSLGKAVQSMATLACPILSCTLYILLYSLVFGIGYHALVITFALGIKIGLWFYPLFLLAVWIIFNIMFNYTMCVLTKPGSPEKIPSYFLNQIQHKCSKCGITKPPRTHHCSICNECVLQMDHHCPWIGTCVGHHNRRYFNNFLSYTTFGLGCMLIMSQFRTMDQLVFALVITLFVVLLLFTSYHWYITLKGQTSLEICFDDPRYQPIQSFSHNIKIVYGTSNIFLCFMPSITPLDNWGNQWEVV